MRRATLRWATLLTLALLARAATGCADKVYDGSSTFYDQHPEYSDQPQYMQPSTTTDADPHASRPW